MALRDKEVIHGLFHDQGWKAVHALRSIHEIVEALEFLGIPAGRAALEDVKAATDAVDEMRILMGEYISADLKASIEASDNMIRGVIAGISIATPKPTTENPIVDITTRR